MENIEKSPVQITSTALDHLIETRKWTMFISVFGLIFIGFCVILIPIIIFTSGNSGFLGLRTSGPIILITIIYFFPIYFLYKFSASSKKAVQNSDDKSLETSFRFLKLHYRFMGIFLIVIFAVYLLAGIVYLISDVLK